VLLIEYSYDSYGRLEKVTSKDAVESGAVVNEVQYEYDSQWGTISKSYQAHGGEVNDSTEGGADSPSVSYAYDDGVSSQVAKYVRLHSVTYPNGRVVYYNYANDTDALTDQEKIGDKLNRLRTIASAAATTTTLAAGAKYAEYTYLGGGTIVEVGHPAVDGGLNLTYGTGGTYGGFDRFGRISEQLWEADNSTDKDQYSYRYDFNSNRIFRENLEKSDLSELYRANDTTTSGTVHYDGYDGLNRLTNFYRGTLNTDKDGIDRTYGRFEGWNPEALGNWHQYAIGVSGSPTLAQYREHNAVNEIADTSGNSDAISESLGSSWLDPVHDDAGNMVFAPRPGDEATQDEALNLVYDAWNRLVAVYADDGTSDDELDENDTLLAEYRCDGLHRRIAKILPDGENWKRTDYYHTQQWQVIEERYDDGIITANKETAVTDVKYQYVWDQRYIDAAIVRDEDLNSDDDCTDAADDVQGSNSGDEHLYYCQDANFNVTALVDVYDGAVVERYMYEPYGEVTVLHGVRNVQGTDTSEDEWEERTSYDFDNEILYCGYRFDPESGLYQVRFRYLHPTLGRWTSRDPIGYADGMSAYAYVASNPSRDTDYSGLYQAGIKTSSRFRCSSQRLYVTTTNCCPYPLTWEIMDEDSDVGRINKSVCSAFKTVHAALQALDFARIWRKAHGTLSPQESGLRDAFTAPHRGVRLYFDLDEVYKEVYTVLEEIADELDDDDGTHYECEKKCGGREAAWSRRRSGWTVHLCPRWQTMSNRFRTRWVIHELSHLYEQTEDYGVYAIRFVPAPMPYAYTGAGGGPVVGPSYEQRLKHADTIAVWAMTYFRE